MADKGSFTVKGSAAVHGVVEITWKDGVFDDPTGMVEVMMRLGESVDATVTGPSFVAAAQPGHVAMLTAVAALDRVDELVGGDEFVAQLRGLSAIPAGAVA
jgi:hypothetical protein